MSGFRFVHAADLHLDSPFSGMRGEASEHIADTLHKATFDAYDNVIRLCLEEHVDALLVAGDIYDSADRSLRAQLRFVDGLNRLDKAGIASFVCHGNHDPLDGWEARLDMPDRCVRFGPEMEGRPIFPQEPERAMVYGISYPKRNVSENLAGKFTKAESEFNIGLLHANVGSNTGHESYAPCNTDDLVRTNINYWALGHVHTRQILRERDPVVAYPGNTQGRHPNEPESHGVYLVDVEQGVPRVEFREVDVVRWKTVRLDIGGLGGMQDLINAIDAAAGSALGESDGRPVIVRVELAGRGRLHHELNRETTDGLVDRINQSYGGLAPWMWCDGMSVNTAPEIDREYLAQQDDFAGYLVRLAADLRTSPGGLADLQGSLNGLYHKPDASPYLRKHLPSQDMLQSLLESAETECLTRLLSGDDDA